MCRLALNISDKILPEHSNVATVPNSGQLESCLVCPAKLTPQGTHTVRMSSYPTPPFRLLLKYMSSLETLYDQQLELTRKLTGIAPATRLQMCI